MAELASKVYQVLTSQKLGHNRILVRADGTDLVVPIVIGFSETQAIMRGLRNEEFVRPLTHDLLIHAIRATGQRIDKVVITKLVDSTFYADLVLKGPKGKETRVDARPSDCIAIAALADVPIFVDDSVIDRAGVKIGMSN